MSNEQKLREALQSISHIDDTTNHSVDASAALDRIGQIARQALSLPTADHIPDAGEKVADHFPDATKMIETAAPVGERELPPLPSYARWEERIKMLMQQCGHPNSMSIYQAFKQFQNEFEHEMIAYARAALSAGDAVDAQRYRWLMDNCTLGIKQNGVGWILNTSACVAPDCIKDVGAAIDTAMRKDKP